MSDSGAPDSRVPITTEAILGNVLARLRERDVERLRDVGDGLLLSWRECVVLTDYITDLEHDVEVLRVGK